MNEVFATTLLFTQADFNPHQLTVFIFYFLLMILVLGVLCGISLGLRMETKGVMGSLFGLNIITFCEFSLVVIKISSGHQFHILSFSFLNIFPFVYQSANVLVQQIS